MPAMPELAGAFIMRRSYPPSTMRFDTVSIDLSADNNPFKDPSYISTREIHEMGTSPSKTFAVAGLGDTDDHDQGDGPAIDSISEFVQLQVELTGTLRRHYAVQNLNDGSCWHVASSKYTRGTPDLTLFEGLDRDAPIIGASRLAIFDKGFDVAVGDPTTPFVSTDPIWIRVKSMAATKIVRTWHLPAANPNDKPHCYTWKRTHNVESLQGFRDEIKLSKLSLRSLKLIEEDTGKVVAVFVDLRRRWGKYGDFYLQSGMSREWTIATFMSGITILEQWRRRD